LQFVVNCQVIAVNRLFIICAVGHIRRTDGFLGLYRGLTPRLLSAVISTVVTNAVNTVSVCYY